MKSLGPILFVMMSLGIVLSISSASARIFEASKFLHLTNLFEIFLKTSCSKAFEANIIEYEESPARTSNEENDSFPDEEDRNELSDEDNLEKTPVVISRSGNANKQSVKATVKFKNLDQGDSPSTAVRIEMKKIGAPGDDAGHLVAKMLGGPGNDVKNFVPMNLSINRGKFRVFETEIRNTLRTNKKLEARLFLDITYNPSDPKYPKRPTTILYVCSFYENNNFKSKIQQTFSNPVKK